MKNLIVLIGVISIFSVTACGQKGKDVPAPVKSSFSQKFPDAKGVKWDMENATEWEAEFKLNGTDYSANFDNAGVWMETEYKINSADLPAAVKATLEAAYAGYTIELSEVSETAEGKVFELELKSGSKETEASIDSNGKLLKKEQAEDEEDEEDDDE